MTPKQELLAFIQRMDDNVTMEQVLYKLNLFVGVQEGLAEADRGEGMDHEAFMKELDEEYEKQRARLDAAGAKRSSRNQKTHRQGRTQAGRRVRSKA